MDIGQRIREAREDLGVPRTVLARRAGVAPNSLYLIETGRRRPSMTMLEKLARELRTDPAELMTETAFPPKGERRPEQPPLTTYTPPTPETVVGTREHLRRADTLDDVDAGAPQLLEEALGHAVLNRQLEDLGQASDPVEIASLIQDIEHEFRWLKRYYSKRRDTEPYWISGTRRRHLAHLYAERMKALTNALTSAVEIQVAQFNKEPANQ